MFKTVTAKLGNMRKEQRFVVELTNKGRFVVQSNKSIGMFDMNTGRGLLNTKGCYFVHLEPALGAVPFEFPADFVQKCHQAFALKGDLIGCSPETGYVYYGGMTEIDPRPTSAEVRQIGYWWEADANIYSAD